MKHVKLHEFPVAERLLLRAVVRDFSNDEFPAPTVFGGGGNIIVSSVRTDVGM
jgi:hypothetical protein